MNKRFFLSASAALVMAAGANAVAADAWTANAGFTNNPGFAYVDRNSRGTVKDLVVEAGIDPSTVELHFAGAQKVEFDEVGTLKITKANGSIWRYKPVVYQVVNGKRRNLTAGFHIMDRDRVSLRVSKVNPAVPLVVGPVDGRNGNS